MKKLKRYGVLFIFFASLSLCHTSSVFAATIIQDVITTDTMWTKDNSPYVISGIVDVNPGATLSIQAGTIIKFEDNATIEIFGAMAIMGTQTEPVYATSIADDSIGGDTDNNGITDPANITNSFVNFAFLSPQGVQKMDYLHFKYGQVYIDSGNLDIAYSLFEHSAISADTSTIHISATSFLDPDLIALDANNNTTIVADTITIQNGKTDGVNIYDNSSLVMSNSTIDTLYGSAIVGFNTSAITIKNTNIDSADIGIEIFNHTSLVADNTTIAHMQYAGVSVYETSTAKITKSLITDTYDGVEIFNNSIVNLDHDKIQDSLDTGIISFGNYGSNSIDISNTDISQNFVGIYSINFTHINTFIDNSIYNNVNGAQTFETNTIDMKNNWWGGVTGPTHPSNLLGTGDVVSDYILFTPWLTIDPINPTAVIPLQYYAKLDASGVINLYELPDTTSLLVKTLPHDWIVKVLSVDPVIANGSLWYKVEDPTDGSQMWTIAAPASISTPIYLPYNENNQGVYQQSGVDILTTKASRAQSIVNAIDHYYGNTSTTPSIDSSDDHSLKISTLVQAGFPKELIMAIAAQESGGINFNNEYVSFDYGHGVMQVTPDAYKNEKPGGKFTNNKEDSRGVLSDIHLKKCDEVNSDNYKKCYKNTESFNNKLKSYDNYQHDPVNFVYKQYTNTTQSIFANIKDGLGILSSKYRHVFVHPCSSSVTYGGEVFSCTDIDMIKAVWGYNGAVTTPANNYLKLISQKLTNLNAYFANHSYPNSDHLIQKLAIANDNRIELKAHSPIAIEAIDSQGRVTGLNNAGDMLSDIPNSYYDPEDETALILFPEDTYTYQVTGDGTGPSYGFDITIERDSASPLVFQASDIPIAEGEIHTFHIDEAVLAAGGNGTTIDIDSDGDGTPEKTITTGALLNDTTPPLIDETLIAPNYILGDKINLKKIISDNQTKKKNIVLSATWDMVPLALTNNTIILPSIGSHSLTITATDQVGNTTTLIKSILVTYIFKGFKPVSFDTISFDQNNKVPIRFSLKSKNGIVIPLLHPTLSIVRSADGYHLPVNPDTFDEDPNCDSDDDCFINHHNRYKYVVPGNSFPSLGQWIITVGLDDGKSYTATVNIIS